METKDTTRVLEVIDSDNRLLLETVEAINGYLISNKGNAADFHLIKNIVDRQVEVVDDEINQMLPVPLYLGLAATMVGIICGLLSLDGDVSSDTFVNSIGHLLSSIKYAMLCSLIGLIMTTCLASVLYRRAKAKMESQVNDFLNFIQMQLLPHLNEDAVATLLNMQANLQKFNSNFERNIRGFSGILEDVHKSFDAQVQLVKQMKNMDMVKMAQFNQNVLAQLTKSMIEFEKFTTYLNQMNSFVTATTKLTDSVNAQLDRTDAIGEVVVGVRDNISKNERVMYALESFLTKIDASKAILAASESLDTAVADSMDNMKKHVEEQVTQLRSYTSTATVELENLMTKEKGNLDHLKGLDNLSALVKSIHNMANENKALSEGLARRIAGLTEAIQNINGSGSNKKGTNVFAVAMIIIMSVIVSFASLLFVVNTFMSQRPNQLQNDNNIVLPVDSIADSLSIVP